MRRGYSGLALTMAAAAAAVAPLMMMKPVENHAPTPRRSTRYLSRLNRSRKWPYARTYQEAREISPFPERPVR